MMTSSSQKELDMDSAKTEGRLEAKQAFDNFISNTSAHGIGRIFETKHGFIRRCVWTAFSLTAILMLILTLIKSFQDINSYPVKTLSSIKLKSPLEFPSVTICNMNPMDLTKYPESRAKAVDEAFFKKSVYGDGQLSNEAASILNELADDLYEETDVETDEFFKACTYVNGSSAELENLNCSAVFKKLRVGFERCFMLDQRSLSHATKRTQLVLTIFVNRPGYPPLHDVIGVKFTIHAPGVIPDTSRLLNQASVGYATNVGIKVTERHYLPHPYRAFGDKKCTDTDTEEFRRLMDGEPELYQTSRGNEYSLDACMNYRGYVAAAAKCNCTMKFIDAPHPLCTLSQMISLKPPHSKIIHDAMNNGDLLGCPGPCRSVTYTHVISSAYFDPSPAFAARYGVNMSEVRKNFLKLRFYFEDLLVHELRHVAEYDQNTIMGLLGGNMGFFIGASMLTVAEVVEVAVIFILWPFKLLWRRIIRSRPVTQIRSRPVTQISLTPNNGVDKTGDVTIDDERINQ